LKLYGAFRLGLLLCTKLIGRTKGDDREQESETDLHGNSKA